MKAAWFWLLLALLLQVAALDAFAWLSEASYGAARTVAESWELPLTHAALVAAGPMALVALGRASWLFWRRSPAPIAAACSLVLCLPSALVGMLHLHTLGCVQSWW